MIRSGGTAGDSTAPNRRATSIYRTLGANLKRKSTCAMVKAQMDWLIDLVKRTSRTHFVHSFLPHNEAGLRVIPERTEGENVLLNVPLLRQQIRGLQLLDAVRLNKIGYPERMPFAEFKRRFGCLAPVGYQTPGDLLDDKQAVKHLIEAMEVDCTMYQLGFSQVEQKKSRSFLRFSYG